MDDKIKVLEKKAWANPDDVKEFIDKMNAMAADKGFNSLVCAGELRDGSIYTGSSRVEDKFKVAAALMFFAMKLMGFKE